MHVRTVTVPASSTVGVFSTLAVLPQGDFDVQMYRVGGVSASVVDDAGATGARFPISNSFTTPIRFSVHNEEVYLRNDDVSPGFVTVLVVQR